MSYHKVMQQYIVLTPDPKEAHSFYYKYIYQENLELEYLCNRYNFESRSPYAWKWELFVALLVGDRRKKIVEAEEIDRTLKEHKGADLENHEIKSSKDKGSFEYQYHIDSWQAKLKEDCRVAHVYISYSSDYKDITVRVLPGETLQPYFKEWEPELSVYWKDEVNGKISNKRFRRQIPYAKVRNEGRIICVIKGTELLYSSNNGMAGNMILKTNKK